MTPRQAELLAFLRQRELAGDISPNYDEMEACLGVGRSYIARIVAQLEAAGAITRLYRRTRSIAVVGIDDYARGYRDGFAAALVVPSNSNSRRPQSGADMPTLGIFSQT